MPLVPVFNNYVSLFLDTGPIRYPPTGNISTPSNYCKGSREFLCDNGRCILSGWRCDYWDDCGDSSDERGCYITVTGTTETYTTDSAPALHLPTGHISTPNNYCLGPREYLCDNGRCILTGWGCDNLDDCGDSSDERGCNITATDTTDTYTSQMSIETKDKETGSSETTFADSSYTLVTDVGDGTPETTPSDNMGLQTTDMDGTATETVSKDTTFNTTTTATGGISKATLGSTGRNTMMDKTLTTENTMVATGTCTYSTTVRLFIFYSV